MIRYLQVEHASVNANDVAVHDRIGFSKGKTTYSG